MAWDEVKPESITELSSVLFDLGIEVFACRGQTRMDKDWEHLTTSLSRAASHWQVATRITWKGDAFSRCMGELEMYLIDQFRQRAHMHLSATEQRVMRSIVGHLGLMQHYGAPTRLLDWTLSPWVAAYFAATDHPNHDGVIWVVEYDALVEKALEEFGSQIDSMLDARNLVEWVEIIAEPFDSVTVVETPLRNSRMTAQQSLHTIAGTFANPHDVLIENFVETEKRKKIIVNVNLKAELMRRLHSMNVTGYSLFGGAEGAGRTLSDLAKSHGSYIFSQEIYKALRGSKS